MCLSFLADLLLAAQCLCCCVRAFSSCSKQGLLFLTVHGLSCCIWDLPRAGIEPMSSVLAGEFLTIGPPGKSEMCLSYSLLYLQHSGESSGIGQILNK